MKLKTYFILFLFGLILFKTNGQNPVIRNQFSADPSARVFNNTVYIYPSHDIANIVKGRKNWFCMEDYHVFSSQNLTSWTDHGVIVDQNYVGWVDTSTYSMWAPDCIEKDGKFYFYFPAIKKDTSNRKGFGIGVAIADKPEGPFTTLDNPIKDVHGIDPNVFIDHDNQAYLYWSAKDIFVAKLDSNMVELDNEPQAIKNLPDKGLKEGPFMFERNGIYYLTYPHVENKTERLEYAIGSSPIGPFKVKGVIMDESATGCWTNHHSIAKYNNQWFLFYHHNDYSPHFDKNRAVRIDSLFFNEDGTIQKVNPTLRGVGITDASDYIQMDRYSKISKSGITIDFIDSKNTFHGWKTVFSEKNGWLQYNQISFENQNYNNGQIRVKSPEGGTVQVFLNDSSNKPIAEIMLDKSNDWVNHEFKIAHYTPGIYNLIIESGNEIKIELDWIRFY